MQQAGELVCVVDGAVAGDEPGEDARDEGGDGGRLRFEQGRIIVARLQVGDRVLSHGDDPPDELL